MLHLARTMANSGVYSQGELHVGFSSGPNQQRVGHTSTTMVSGEWLRETGGVKGGRRPLGSRTQMSEGLLAEATVSPVTSKFF